MSEIPERPDWEPTSWVTVFYYFDSIGPGGLSRPTAWDSKEAALGEAQMAPDRHNGGGVKVRASYAYPPVGSEEQPVKYTF